jgi:serine/threonine protein kinase
LIDFGSATITNPNDPRPSYTAFFGTPHYAASEILRKKPYQAAPAEIWTLGVLLSYLLTGASPFANVWDAVDGRIFLSRNAASSLSKEAMDLMKRCLDPDPATRATVVEVREHVWLKRHSDSG